VLLDLLLDRVVKRFVKFVPLGQSRLSQDRLVAFRAPQAHSPMLLDRRRVDRALLVSNNRPPVKAVVARVLPEPTWLVEDSVCHVRRDLSLRMLVQLLVLLAQLAGWHLVLVPLFALRVVWALMLQARECSLALSPPSVPLSIRLMPRPISPVLLACIKSTLA